MTLNTNNLSYMSSEKQQHQTNNYVIIRHKKSEPFSKNNQFIKWVIIELQHEQTVWSGRLMAINVAIVTEANAETKQVKHVEEVVPICRIFRD